MTLDASRAKYKFKERPASMPGLRRMEASITPSVTRLPAMIRDPWLSSLRSPVVLFFHPWEFVDVTASPIPYDCRFRTGQPALDSLRATIRLFRDKGARFRLARDFPST